MRLLLVGYAALLAAGRGPAPAQAAPMAEHFSRADVDAYVEAAVRTLGDSESNTAERDYAVRLLGVLGHPSVASGYKSSACSAAAAGLLSGDLEQIHHGISLATGVGGCTNAKTSTASEEVRAAMQERHDLFSLYHATLAAPLLEVDQATGGVLDKVLDLVKPDGSVRGYPGGPAEDGNAFMAAGLLAALVPSAEGVAQTIALRTVETLKDSVLASEPSLLVQLNRAHGSNFFVKATKLKSMARDLLEASHTGRPKGMLAAYEAIKAIESYDNAPFPVKLVPSSPSVKEMASGGVGLLVTSLLGTPASVKSAVLSKLTRADGSNALTGSKTGSPLGAPNAEGLRPLPAASVAAGLYTAEFSVELEGVEEGKALTAKIPMAVGTAVKLARTRVSVSTSKNAPTLSLSLIDDDEDDVDVDEVGAANYLLSPGKTLPGDAQASTLDGHHLHVRLSLTGGGGDATALPHQVFVRFTHAITGLDTFFVAAPVETPGGGGGGKGSSGEFSVSVSLGEESATFLQRSGAYELAVLVGGPLVSPPVLEQLGVIDLDFPVTKGRNWPLYARPLLHETDVALGPLPEKHHTFREPEVRPHAGVSLLFTALVLAPLAGLARAMRLGGADLRRLPRSTSGRMWCVLYQACMVSVVLLFATYWAALTMAYTLRVLAVLSLATTVTGRKALQSIALEEEEKGVSKGGGSGSSSGGGNGSSGSGSHAKVE